MQSLSKLLIFLIFSTSCVAYPEEEIYKPYEIDNVLITFFWFDTDEEMQVEYVKAYEEHGIIVDDQDSILGFSELEPYLDKNFCHLDLYAVRPLMVDDDMTLTIGHEVLHCVHGKGYHR